MKRIGIHLDRCTGCKTCELYCAVERGSNEKALLKAVQEVPLPQARVRVESTPSGPFALQCRQCQNAPCLDACLAGALVRDSETGMVLIREERCIACWTCTLFCPYGVIYPWPERKMALKCDRCNFMEYPVCVEVCPTKALELVDLDDFQKQLQARRQRIATAVVAESRQGLCVLDLADKA